MAPITRSMCVRAKRPTKSSSSSVRKSTKKQSGVVATRTSSKHKKHTDDKASSSSSCSKDDEEEEIFPADLLPEWVLVHIFSFLSVKEKCRLTRVSKKWSLLVKDPRLWRLVTDSPQGSGDLLKFIRTFLGNSLWCFIPKTLTAAGLKLLENRCPHLKYLLVNYTFLTQAQHFRHLNLGLYFPVKANGVILRIPLSPVDKDLVGFLVVSKNLKRVDWNIIQRYEEFAPIVKMMAEVKKEKGSVEDFVRMISHE
ncbi:uncharacterized protein [Amphiura filiformis]|uniref:uncharacterized protein isoform X1 n=1 Tax=Amphiura filiformis TaxID=82378 RepID=UPI003B20CC9A